MNKTTHYVHRQQKLLVYNIDTKSAILILRESSIVFLALSGTQGVFLCKASLSYLSQLL